MCQYQSIQICRWVRASTLQSLTLVRREPTGRQRLERACDHIHLSQRSAASPWLRSIGKVHAMKALTLHACGCEQAVSTLLQSFQSQELIAHMPLTDETKQWQSMAH